MRAILILLDGLRPDLVTPARMPRLAALAAAGTRFAQARSVFPSETRVATSSLVTGCRPAAHGLTANTIFDAALAPDRLLAVTVVTDDEEANELAEQWAKHDIPVELHTLHSPYRNLTRPVLRFLDELDAEDRDDIITVVIPEFVVSRWYLQVLHNQTALALKARLLFRPNTVVTSVPIHIGEPAQD